MMRKRSFFHKHEFSLVCTTILVIIAGFGFILSDSGQRFAQITGMPVRDDGSDIKITYFHQDRLGSTVAKTDSDGGVVWSSDYAPFGQPFDEIADDAQNKRKYNDKELDEDTGLYYYGARYYDPDMGRFTNPDIVPGNPADPQSLNRYAYVKNNPMKYIDPTGNVEIPAPPPGYMPADFAFTVEEAGDLYVNVKTSGRLTSLEQAKKEPASMSLGWVGSYRKTLRHYSYENPSILLLSNFDFSGADFDSDTSRRVSAFQSLISHVKESSGAAFGSSNVDSYYPNIGAENKQVAELLLFEAFEGDVVSEKSLSLLREHLNAEAKITSLKKESKIYGKSYARRKEIKQEMIPQLQETSDVAGGKYLREKEDLRNQDAQTP